MVKGAFKKIHHLHSFEYQDGKTTMTDVFDFEAPFGMIGDLFSVLFLKNYMKGFLISRNKMIKETAESEDWKKLLAVN
jgi:ligand-binding SRPBCC domain-containing protein